MILVTYEIDKAVYDNPHSIHNVVLTTTLYSFKRQKLVHLQYGKLLQNKLEARLKGSLESEQFMLEHENGSIEPLMYDQFQKKLAQLDSKHTAKEQEILESYCYIDKRGQQEIVQVIISIKRNGMEAMIEFKSVAQCENFVPAAWLICQNDDEVKLEGSRYG